MWSNKLPQIPDVKNSVSINPNGQIASFANEDKDRVLSFINTRRARYTISDEEIEKERETIQELYLKGWVKIEKAFESKLDSIDEISNKLNYFLDGGDTSKKALSYAYQLVVKDNITYCWYVV